MFRPRVSLPGVSIGSVIAETMHTIHSNQCCKFQVSLPANPRPMIVILKNLRFRWHSIGYLGKFTQEAIEAQNVEFRYSSQQCARTLC